MDEEEQLQRALAASLGLVYEPEAVRSAFREQRERREPRAPPVDYCELSDEDRLIREQQDLEYQESLEIDRAKMATLAEAEPKAEPQVEPVQQFVELDWRPFMSSGYRLRLVGSFATMNVTIQAEAPIEALFSFLFEKLGRHVNCRFQNQLLPREGLVSDHLCDRCVVRVE